MKLGAQLMYKVYSKVISDLTNKAEFHTLKREAQGHILSLLLLPIFQ
jgi:hypothetical protein